MQHPRPLASTWSIDTVWTWRSYRLDARTVRRELRHAAIGAAIFFAVVSGLSAALVHSVATGAPANTQDTVVIKPTPERAL